LILLLVVSCATNRSVITQNKGQVNNHRLRVEFHSSIACPPTKQIAATKVNYKPVKKRHRKTNRNVKLKTTFKKPFINRKPDSKLTRMNKPASVYPFRVLLPGPIAENTSAFTGSLNQDISMPYELRLRSSQVNHTLPLPIAERPSTKTAAYVGSPADAALSSNVKSKSAGEESFSYSPLSVTADTNEETGSSMSGMRNTKQARLLLFTLISGIAGFLGLGLASINNKKALQISTWAARKKRSSRFLVVILNILLPIGGFLVGSWFNRLGLDLPANSKLAMIGLLGLTALSYPLVRPVNTGVSRHYRRRKFHDLLIVLGSILFFISAGNNHFSERATNPIQKNLSFSEYRSNRLSGENSIIAGTTYSTGDWVLDQVNIKQPGLKRKMKPWNIVLLTILSTALLLASGYGLAILSCSIACNGYDTAAFILLFGGAAGLIALFIVSLKAIFRKEIVLPDTSALIR